MKKNTFFFVFVLLIVIGFVGSTAANGIEPVRTWEHPGFTLGEVAFSPDGSLLAVANWDDNAYVYDVDNGELVLILPHENNVYAVEFSTDGNKIATGGKDKAARIWDINGNLLNEFQHNNFVYDLAFSPDGNKLITQTETGTLFLWDLASEEYLPFSAPQNASYWITGNVSFSPLGELLTGNTSWSFPSLDILGVIPSYEGKFSQDGSKILSAGYSEIQVISPNREILSEFAYTMNLNPKTFVIKNNGLVFGGGSTNSMPIVIIWDSSGNEIARLQAGEEEGEITGLALSPDENWLASADNEGFLRLWDISSLPATAEPTPTATAIPPTPTATPTTFIPQQPTATPTVTLTPRPTGVPNDIITLPEWQEPSVNGFTEVFLQEFSPGSLQINGLDLEQPGTYAGFPNTAHVQTIALSNSLLEPYDNTTQIHGFSSDNKQRAAINDISLLEISAADENTGTLLMFGLDEEINIEANQAVYLEVVYRGYGQFFAGLIDVQEGQPIQPLGYNLKTVDQENWFTYKFIRQPDTDDCAVLIQVVGEAHIEVFGIRAYAED